MSSITVQKDLRGRFGPARDQGARPTCLAFAMSDTHAAALTPWSELSCEYLFFHAKKREKTALTTGVTTTSIRQAVEHDGQPVEADWNYLDAIPADVTLWAPPTKIGTVFRRASAMLAGGFDEAWKTVDTGTPVLVVMSISNAFYTPDNAGVVNSAEAVDSSRRHAVVATATGELAGVKCLLARNSWGETWGLQGHAWLAEPYVKPRIMLMLTIN
jgi:Papain family cysteine protease